MASKVRVGIGIAAGVLILLGVGALGIGELVRRSATAALRNSGTPAPGSITLVWRGESLGYFTQADLAGLETVSFTASIEGKLQEGWRLRDVLLRYLPEERFTPDTSIRVISSRRGKAAELTWAEVAEPANWVLFDRSHRGTLKLVSELEKLDTRDEWVQDVDRIEIDSND